MAFGINQLIYASIFFITSCHADTQINYESPQKWISEIMTEAEMEFDMVNNLVSEKCRNDFDIYKKHLSNQTIWAVRILESSEWPKLSIFSGLTYHYGNFEECLKAQGNNIQGQYCLANIKYNFNYEDNEKEKHIWKVNPPENESAWKYVKRFELELSRLSRQSLTWALCIPSSCSWDDLNRTLDRLITPIFKKYGLVVKTSVKPEYCQMRNKDNLPYSFHLIKYSFYIYLSIIILATLYGSYFTNSNDHGKSEIINNFSLIKSYQRLTRVNEGSRFNNVNVFKILIVIGAIINHTKVFRIILPTFQMEDFETDSIFILKFLISHFIDLVFFLSGILLFLDQKWMKVPLNIFIIIMGFKWISTSLILFIAWIFHQYVFPYMGSSPIWNIKGHLLDSRRDSYFDIIFLVGNLLPLPNLSMPATWSVFVHFQIYLICGILFYIFNKKWQRWPLLVALYAVSTIYTFMIIWALNLEKNIVLSPRIIMPCEYIEDKWVPDICLVYWNPIHRISAFVIGCATTLIVEDQIERNYKNLSMIGIFFGGVVLYLFTWGPVIYLISITSDNYNVTVFGKAIFHSVRSTLFLIPAVYTAYFILKFDTINSIKNIINLRMMSALSRLCKSLCIVSYTYQQYNEKKRKRISSDNSALDIFEKSITDVVMSIIISFFWYLIIEGPITNILDMIIRNSFSKSEKFECNEILEKQTSNPKED